MFFPQKGSLLIRGDRVKANDYDTQDSIMMAAIDTLLKRGGSSYVWGQDTFFEVVTSQGCFESGPGEAGRAPQAL